MELRELQYPIGEFVAPDVVSDEQLAAWIDEIERFPSELRPVVQDLPDDVLDTRYRPGGWTVRQVVHHLADSHLNSYVRFKWALTEDKPLIKAYFEERWAELPDYKRPVASSLDFLDVLHACWVPFLRSLNAEQFGREFQHPDADSPTKLSVNAGIYAWHGRHHLAHVTGLLSRLER